LVASTSEACSRARGISDSVELMRILPSSLLDYLFIARATVTRISLTLH
jgi:hypothetical protein